MGLFKPFEIFPKKKKERSDKEKAIRGAVCLAVLVGGYLLVKTNTQPVAEDVGKESRFSEIAEAMNGKIDSLLMDRCNTFLPTDTRSYEIEKVNSTLPYPKENELLKLNSEKSMAGLFEKPFDKEKELSNLQRDKEAWMESHPTVFFSRKIEFTDSAGVFWTARQRLYEDGRSELVYFTKGNQNTNFNENTDILQ